MSDEYRRFYVYVFFTPDGDPLYVGKGAGDRYFAHTKRSHNKALQGYIDEFGDRLPSLIIRRGLLEYEALDVEAALIAVLGRRGHGGLLVNVSEGGNCVTMGSLYGPPPPPTPEAPPSVRYADVVTRAVHPEPGTFAVSMGYGTNYVWKRVKERIAEMEARPDLFDFNYIQALVTRWSIAEEYARCGIRGPKHVSWVSHGHHDNAHVLSHIQAIYGGDLWKWDAIEKTADAKAFQRGAEDDRARRRGERRVWVANEAYRHFVNARRSNRKKIAA